MPLFRIFLLMTCWIKFYLGQKIDDFNPSCPGPDKMEFLKIELSDLRRIVNKQDKKMETLEKELNAFKESAEKVSEMKGTIQQLTSNQEIMAEKMSQEIAFTAELKNGKAIPNLKENEKIVFSHVVTSRGNAYNNDTGIFRCPRSGLYAFFFNILTLRSKWANVVITVNGNQRYSKAYSEGVSEGTNGSNFVLLRLTAGDEVWLKAGKNWLPTGEVLKYSENTFSGFLVHPY